ncbi:MAG: HmuY family protein [Bacteroidales bacterium]
MKIKFLRILCIGIGFCLWTACQKEPQGPSPAQNIKTVLVDGRNFDRWIYFSFQKGDTVQISNPQTDLRWDIAFHRWDVKTNGGLSGVGKGEAKMTKFTDFNISMALPLESEWVKDTFLLTYMHRPIMSDSAPAEQRSWVPANKELGKWLLVNMSIIPPVYTMAKNIYWVRSAGGKMVQLRFDAYMNERAEKGYVKFSYWILEN